MAIAWTTSPANCPVANASVPQWRVRWSIIRPACSGTSRPATSMTAATVFELMLELNRARHTSLVLVTHDRSLARRLDRVLELREGRLHALAHADV